MSKKLILCVLGTRPEAIKLAPVIAELRRRPSLVTKVCVTAQHREMLDQVLKVFEIVPDHDLNLMTANQTSSQLAAAIFRNLEPVLDREQPDWMLVQGDTTSTAVAALTAFYGRVKVGHVEAGLRSHNKWQPYPEEINRRLSTVIADLHFAPTQRARENLLREGTPRECILVTGNPIVDALEWVKAQPAASKVSELVESVSRPSAKLILVTAHRRENFGAPIRSICRALRAIAEHYRDQVRILYPVHRNPNICRPVHDLLDGIPNVSLVPPLEYVTLVQFLKQAYMVLTDSGGLQEEAPALGVPALVLREVTERPEGVETGNVRLVGTDCERIVREASRLLEHPSEYQRMARAVNPYGDGRAAQRIAGALLGEHVEEFRPVAD